MSIRGSSMPARPYSSSMWVDGSVGLVSRSMRGRRAKSERTRIAGCSISPLRRPQLLQILLELLRDLLSCRQGILDGLFALPDLPLPRFERLAVEELAPLSGLSTKLHRDMDRSACLPAVFRQRCALTIVAAGAKLEPTLSSGSPRLQEETST